MRLFTRPWPLNFVARHAIVGHPCFSYAEACLPPDICLGLFLELDHQIYLDFARVLVTIMKLCMATRFF